MMLTADLFIQRPFFQFVSAFSTFNIGEMVWEQYEQFAIPTIENANRELQATLDVIPTLTPEEAKSQLNTIGLVLPKLGSLRENLNSINDREFEQFKSVSLAFFSSLDQVEKELRKAAEQQDATRAVFQHMTRHRKNPALGKYL